LLLPSSGTGVPLSISVLVVALSARSDTSCVPVIAATVASARLGYVPSR
jgi:hypothetical protein